MGFKIKFLRPVGAAVGRKMALGWKDIVLEEAGKSGSDKGFRLKLVLAEDKSTSSITSQ